MKKLAEELMKKNDSYVGALKEAIEMWEKASVCTKEKEDSLVAVGQIGNKIYKQNSYFGLNRGR